MGMCGIEDPRSKSIILTGGYDFKNNKNRTNAVRRYDENGFVEDLPPMIHARSGSGCAGYYDTDGYLVIL